MEIPGRFLVRGSGRRGTSGGRAAPARVLAADTSLSFWGGIDPVTARVVDQTHPLVGETVTDALLCLPSGRGSCTASQVLLELILNDRAPRAIILRDVDGLACVGALIAQEVFDKRDLDIICVGEEGYRKLLQSQAKHGKIRLDGALLLGDNGELSEVNDSMVRDSNNSDGEQCTYNAEEIALLEQCQTQAERMAFQVIFRYARLLADDGADSVAYVPISNAHIDGCTYIGPGGLEFVRRLVAAGGKVRVPTTLNSVSADRQRWQALQVPADRATASIELGDAYLDLGCQPSFTCAPYLLPNPPSLGQDIAWGESNAVVFANSVLGAKTEKLADYLDICCAISGIVPAVGVHLPQNRRPSVLLDAQSIISEISGIKDDQNLDMLFPILGHLCGSLSDGKVPILIGLETIQERVTIDNLKAFCAAFGTSGSSPLIHVAGITPEAKDAAAVSDLVSACKTSREITFDDLASTFHTLDSYNGDETDIDLIALGNPHLSLSECATLAHLITSDGGQKTPSIRVVACLSRAVYDQAQSSGYISPLERFGVEFINDTCWCMLLDHPLIPRNPKAKILSNSGKYAHYGPALTNRSFRFGSLNDCVQTAMTGFYAKRALSAKDANSMASLFSSFQRRSFSAAAVPLIQICLRKGIR